MCVCLRSNTTLLGGLPGYASQSELLNFSLFCELNCSVTQLGFILCDPWTAACQASLSMEFSRQEYWSGLPLPPPRDLPNPGMEIVSCTSCVAGRFFTAEPPGKHSLLLYIYLCCVFTDSSTKCHLQGGRGFCSVHCYVLSTGYIVDPE